MTIVNDTGVMKDTDPGRVAGRGVALYRAHLDWSLDKLSAESAVSKAQISLAERGERGLSVNALVRLAAAMRVEPQWLLELPVEAGDVPDIDYGQGAAIRGRTDRGGRLRTTWLEHLGRVRRPVPEDPMDVMRLEPIEDAYVDASLQPLRVVRDLRRKERR